MIDGRYVSQYARTPDNSKICYSCAAKQIKDDMATTGKAILYYDDAKTVVTDFTGKLWIPIFRRKTSIHNMARVRYDYWFSFYGYVWHGYTIGDNTSIAHCKQTKKIA
jgi:hypothetical protein